MSMCTNKTLLRRPRLPYVTKTYCPRECRTVSFRLKRLLIPSLRGSNHSHAKVCQRLKRCKCPKDIQLRYVQFVLLYFQVCQLSSANPLSNGVPTTVRLRGGPNCQCPCIYSEMHRRFQQLPRRTKVFSKGLHLSKGDVTFQQRRYVCSSVSYFYLCARTWGAFFTYSFGDNVRSLQRLSISFHLHTGKV